MSAYKPKLLQSTKGLDVNHKSNNDLTFNPTPMNPKTPGKVSKSVERNSIINTTSILKAGQRESINSTVMIEEGPGSVEFNEVKEVVQSTSKKRVGLP